MLIKNLYEIRSFNQEENRIRAVIFLHKEHDIFKGHFPGNPIMPGVCMIQIIKELAEKSIGKEIFLRRSSNIKFMAIINPEKDPLINLEIEISSDEDQVKVKAVALAKEVPALKLSAEFEVLA